MPSTEALNAELARQSPGAIVKRALELFGTDLAIAFSGSDDVLLIEYAKQSGHPFRVFCLDTGRLHAQTYRFIEQVEKHYGIRIEASFPDSGKVEDLVRRKGLFSFYEDGHSECCAIRKVEPLHRRLSGLRAWMTGQRQDQGARRASLAIVEEDASIASQTGRTLVKFNPLAQVDEEYVWNAIRGFEVPYNELHAQGMLSIGCEPCTRSILPGQHARDGRWWWEAEEHKECGLHRDGNEKLP